MVGGDKTIPTKIGTLVGIKAEARMCHGMISFVSGFSLAAIRSFLDLKRWYSSSVSLQLPFASALLSIYYKSF